jgi:microcystin-dependent protein
MSNPTEDDGGSPFIIDLEGSLSRRDVLKLAAGGTVLMLAACTDDPLNPGQSKTQGPFGNVALDRGGGDPFLSEIMICSFNFAPKGWAMCNGQFLPINQNQALFALLGTTYGGNGQTTFALPDLRGRVPMHMGSGHTLGEKAGAASSTISLLHLPQHTHAMSASGKNGDKAPPTSNYLAAVNSLYSPSLNRILDPRRDRIPLDAVPMPAPVFSSSGGATTTMNPASVTNVGGSQAHNNMQPYLTLNFCIALQGIFPSQN